MMYGYNWFGNGGCRFGLWGGYFGIWHFAMLAVVVLLVVAVVLVVLKRKKRASQDDVLDTLKRLYVSGEISEEDYLKRKSVIERR
ncbi:SHOCT domain-containing protein [Acidaminobacter hydrogenoformans]|uniref:Putative membrane protein n=1 Tax=Acidaminobacter hydrogenoformans DSM 2784 TaxID=1120920 RepID=A0A1G5S3J8_9FIRM|nr:SHOCT domain-containing protein [Acidaminobacter hydrogenoformans]SCZ80903.1 putative membrane protein [Acidaminobacter hydrogenoformans DSM 2784]